MTTYLDKEAVLKAWEDTVNVPGTECMIKRVQRGEFDVNGSLVLTGYKSALADKDVEIYAKDQDIIHLRIECAHYQNDIAELKEEGENAGAVHSNRVDEIGGIMTDYLNKEAVLKAAKDAMVSPEYAVGLVMGIETGQFDAHMGPICSQCNIRLAHIDLKDKMQGKEAEIARLKHNDEIWAANMFNEKQRSGISIGRFKQENAQLKYRIAELEKLCDMQKATIDQQGEALQVLQEKLGWPSYYRISKETLEGLEDAFNSQFKNVGEPGWRSPSNAISCFEAYCARVRNGYQLDIIPKQPAQKEPELVICNHAEGCQITVCNHIRPHEQLAGCLFERCNSRPGIPAKCVPVKSPVPTSGTGTAPEGATVEQKEPDNPSGRDMVKVYLGSLIRQGVKFDKYPTEEHCQKIGNAIWESFGFVKEQTYPGMAKDIGDLTLRVDNLESRLETCFKRHGVYETRTHETNSKIIELETALKSLQEEVKAIPKIHKNILCGAEKK